MARQIGIFKITGTYYGVCYYLMHGVYYARMESSLTSEKFWRAKCFEASRKSCKRFGEGNKLASEVYRSLPDGIRKYEVFKLFKKHAILLLKVETPRQEIVRLLLEIVMPVKRVKAKIIQTSTSGNKRPAGIVVTTSNTALTPNWNLRTQHYASIPIVKRE